MVSSCYCATDVMVTQACKLNLPNSRPSLEIQSLLFDNSSNTLALMHSDSSILLLPSLSPFSPSSVQSQTLIPPLCSSSTFLRLQSAPNSANHRTLFLVAGPRHGESRVLLRFWILKNSMFVRAKVTCSQTCFSCDDNGFGVLVDLAHGASLKVVGSVNVFVLHSVSENKIWVFSAKMIGDEEGHGCVKLIKCGVIYCSVPICLVSVCLGFLVLGESGGVRVFPLRYIVKGRVKKGKELIVRKEKKNGADGRHMGKSVARKELGEVLSNGYVGKAEMNYAHSKLRTVKLKHDSTVGGTFFVAFNSLEVPCQTSSKRPLLPLRAVSVHALAERKFLVLDSDGDLHLLSLQITVPSSEFIGHMRNLNHTMKVRMMAVLPDISTRTQTFWISDGLNSVHVMSLSDMELSVNENDKCESGEQLQISVMQALFVSEKIQDMIPLSSTAILILGQGYPSSPVTLFGWCGWSSLLKSVFFESCCHTYLLTTGNILH